MLKETQTTKKDQFLNKASLASIGNNGNGKPTIFERVFGNGSGETGLSVFSKILRRNNHRIELKISAEVQFRAVSEELSHNKFKDLLALRCSDPDELKIRLKQKFVAKNWSMQTLEACFEDLDAFFAGKFRNDGVTPFSAHLYAVGLGTVMLGCNEQETLTAIFHDKCERALAYWLSDHLREYSGKDEAITYWNRFEKQKLLRAIDNLAVNQHSFAGAKLRLEDKSVVGTYVDMLTKIPGEINYDYLNRIYTSGNINLMVIKAVDTIHNLLTLYFDDCSIELKVNTITKALRHIDFWRKLNKDLFDFMFTLIADQMKDKEVCAAVLQYIEKHPEDTSGKAFTYLLGHPNGRFGSYKNFKSDQQQEREKNGVVYLGLREPTLESLANIPNSKTPVITIWSHVLMGWHQKRNEFPEFTQNRFAEFEFPDYFGRPNEIQKVLASRFPTYMYIEKVESKMSVPLRSTYIFRGQLKGTREEYKHINTVLLKLSKDLKESAKMKGIA